MKNNYPILTYLERSAIPIDQSLVLLNFDNNGKPAELPAGIGGSVQYGKS